MEKTLFVSDLDGTLLKNDETLSRYTCDIINTLVNRGMIFSYATARSIVTAKKVTSGIQCQMPLIVHNGTFIVDSVTDKRLIENYFIEDEIKKLRKVLENNKIYPIVYSVVSGEEKFSFVEELCTPQLKAFIATRNDKRKTPVQNAETLYNGQVYYITCVATKEKLHTAYEQLKDDGRFNVIYSTDVYTDGQWLEIMPKNATKAQSVLKLKELYNCDRVICFGDHLNDISMFKMADECYAVANAQDELKAIATGVIDSNENDGVAKWLEENFKQV